MELVQTFHTEELKGSPQFLHFFNSSQEQKIAFKNFQVEEDVDHSFVFLKEPGFVEVAWRNRKSSIQFCGSGAYALSWRLLSKSTLPKLTIETSQAVYASYRKDEKVFLTFQGRLPEAKGKVLDYQVFYAGETGVYYVLLNQAEELRNEELSRFILQYFSNEFKDSIHGLCLFHWSEGHGTLRYFTPWHGREEDHVTGSIHQYLTPLVHELFHESRQLWTQLSILGGYVETLWEQGTVSITGNCSLATNE